MIGIMTEIRHSALYHRQKHLARGEAAW